MSALDPAALAEGAALRVTGQQRADTLAHYLQDAIETSDGLYEKGFGVLAGSLQAPAPTSVATRMRLLVMRLDVSMRGLSPGYSIALDHPTPRPEGVDPGEPIALLLARPRHHVAVPIMRSANAIAIGATVICLGASDAGERLQGAIIAHVAAFFEGRTPPKAVVQ